MPRFNRFQKVKILAQLAKHLPYFCFVCICWHSVLTAQATVEVGSGLSPHISTCSAFLRSSQDNIDPFLIDPVAEFDLQTSKQTLQAKFITPEVVKQSFENYQNKSLSAREKAKRAFQIYLEARLVNESALVREAAVGYLRRATYKIDNELEGIHLSTKVSGGDIVRIPHMLVTIPEELFQTELFYYVQVHELEHFLQETRIMELASADLQAQRYDLDMFYEYAAERIYVREIGAMAAEFHFLSLVPPDVFASLVRRSWKVDGDKTEALGKVLLFFEEMLMEPIYKAQTYVQKKWAADFYSFDNTISHANQLRAKVGLPPKDYSYMNDEIQ